MMPLPNKNWDLNHETGDLRVKNEDLTNQNGCG
jgi:hypothetical protein